MRLFRPIIRGILALLPYIEFPRLNVWLFRRLGYSIASSVRVYSSSQIMGNIAVDIGHGTFIGHQTLITGGDAKIIIGEDCDISDRVIICCGSHEIDLTKMRTAGRGYGKDIVIGNGVWIGFGALVLPGITIGDKCIVAAGCVVNKDVEPMTVVGGNPMRVIRKLHTVSHHE